MIRTLLLLAIAAFATPANAFCVNMERPPVGTTAGVGPLFTVPAGSVSLRPFKWLGGGWTAGGAATIVASNHANGSPTQEDNLNNITFSVVPTNGANIVTFNYADFGGNVNLWANGVLANLNDLSAAPPMLGGLTVTVSRVDLFGWHFGTVTMTGNILQAGVGGQEFFLDDFCW